MNPFVREIDQATIAVSPARNTARPVNAIAPAGSAAIVTASSTDGQSGHVEGLLPSRRRRWARRGNRQ